MNTRQIIETICENTWLEPEIETLIPGLEKMCVQPFQPSNPIHRAETVAVSFDKPKSTALFYDRVWKLFGAVPESIAFGGDSSFEKKMFLANFFLENSEGIKETVFSPVQVVQSPFNDFLSVEKKCIELLKNAGLIDFVHNDPEVFPSINKLTRFLASYFSKQISTDVTPVYAGLNILETEYRPGNHESLISSVTNLNIVDEKKLEWDQIIELRNDKEAKKKLRRLRHWLDSNMVGKSAAYIEDDIAIKVEDYNWSIKKHGLKTIVGSLTSVLNSKFIAANAVFGAYVSFTTSPLWGILAGAGITVGKVGVNVAKIALDLDDIKRGENYEIAYIQEVEKKLYHKS